MKSFRLILAVCITLICGSGYAGDTSNSIVINNAVISLAAPSAPVAGGYLTLINKTVNDDQLVSATADFAGKVELHKSLMENGVMKMRKQESGVPIPHGSMVEFKLGGLHIMFMKLKRSLAPGDTESVTLMFKKTGSVTVEFTVVDASTSMDAMKMHKKDSNEHTGHAN